MCEVLWPHTHVMVDVPCGYSFLFVNQYSGFWMFLIEFDRLGAMIKSVVYATTGNWKFSHVGSMRPVILICIYSFVCDGSIWEPVLITQLSMYYSPYLYLYFASWEKFAKMSLIANGLNAFHVYTHVLHAICDRMAIGQYSSIVFIYLLNCDIFVLWYM